MLRHIAIIMDGNGRWAKSRHLPRSAGHKKGAETARNVVLECKNLNVPYLTLYAFSAENWKRPVSEVTGLMNLLRYYLENEVEKLHENNVRIRILGDQHLLDKDIQEKITDIERTTASNTAIHLNIALSYGSRQELTNAFINMIKKIKEGSLNPSEITEKEITAHLYTHDIPDPDLLIRTGGEQRLSNFLLWQAAYSELYFTDTLWPDFSKEDLEAAIHEFHQRERRFGNAPEEVAVKQQPLVSSPEFLSLQKL